MLEQCWCFPGRAFIWKRNAAEQSFLALPRAPTFPCPVCVQHASRIQALPAKPGCGLAWRLFFFFPSLRNTMVHLQAIHVQIGLFMFYTAREKETRSCSCNLANGLFFTLCCLKSLMFFIKLWANRFQSSVHRVIMPRASPAECSEQVIQDFWIITLILWVGKSYRDGVSGGCKEKLSENRTEVSPALMPGSTVKQLRLGVKWGSQELKVGFSAIKSQVWIAAVFLFYHKKTNEREMCWWGMQESMHMSVVQAVHFQLMLVRDPTGHLHDQSLKVFKHKISFTRNSPGSPGAELKEGALFLQKFKGTSCLAIYLFIYYLIHKGYVNAEMGWFGQTAIYGQKFFCQSVKCTMNQQVP